MWSGSPVWFLPKLGRRGIKLRRKQGPTSWGVELASARPERKFRVLLTAPRKKKKSQLFSRCARNNGRVARKHPKKREITPAKKKRNHHQKSKNTTKTRKNTQFFFSRLRAKNKSRRQNEKANSHGPAGAIKQENFSLCWTGACYWHGVGGFMVNSSSSGTGDRRDFRARILLQNHTCVPPPLCVSRAGCLKTFC